MVNSLPECSVQLTGTVQRKTAVTYYLKSKQLLLFVFELQDSLLPSSTGIPTAVQRQTAVTAYLKSKQLMKVFLSVVKTGRAVWRQLS